MYLMPHLHLVYDHRRVTVNWLYPSNRTISLRWHTDDCMIFVRIHGLRRVSVASTILFSAEFIQISNHKIVDLKHIVGGIQWRYLHLAVFAQPLYGNRTIYVRFPWICYCNRAEIARSPYDPRTISVQSPYSLCTALSLAPLRCPIHEIARWP